MSSVRASRYRPGRAHRPRDPRSAARAAGRAAPLEDRRRVVGDEHVRRGEHLVDLQVGGRRRRRTRRRRRARGRRFGWALRTRTCPGGSAARRPRHRSPARRASRGRAPRNVGAYSITRRPSPARDRRRGPAPSRRAARAGSKKTSVRGTPSASTRSRAYAGRGLRLARCLAGEDHLVVVAMQERRSGLASTRRRVPTEPLQRALRRATPGPPWCPGDAAQRARAGTRCRSNT